MTQEKLPPGQQPATGYNPFNGVPLSNPATPDCWRGPDKHAWMFNPWCGSPRDLRDVALDPHGEGIWSRDWGPMHAAPLHRADGSPAQAGDGLGFDAKSGGHVAIPAFDVVQKAEHYNQGSVECIDAIRAALTSDEFRGFCKGNALKYIWRERHKGGDESLRKADYYLDQLVQP